MMGLAAAIARLMGFSPEASEPEEAPLCVICGDDVPGVPADLAKQFDAVVCGEWCEKGRLKRVAGARVS